MVIEALLHIALRHISFVYSDMGSSLRLIRSTRVRNYLVLSPRSTSILSFINSFTAAVDKVDCRGRVQRRHVSTIVVVEFIQLCGQIAQ